MTGGPKRMRHLVGSGSSPSGPSKGNRLGIGMNGTRRMFGSCAMRKSERLVSSAPITATGITGAWTRVLRCATPVRNGRKQYAW